MICTGAHASYLDQGHLALWKEMFPNQLHSEESIGRHTFACCRDLSKSGTSISMVYSPEGWTGECFSHKVRTHASEICEPGQSCLSLTFGWVTHERQHTVFEAQDDLGSPVEARDQVGGRLIVACKHGRAKVAQLHLQQTADMPQFMRSSTVQPFPDQSSGSKCNSNEVMASLSTAV